MLNYTVIYYSGWGHTQSAAQAMARGMETDTLIAVPKDGVLTDAQWAILDESHVIAFAAPTYMGSIAGPFKLFMDSTSQKWSTGAWKDKIAGGLINSGGLSGDKLLSMMQLVAFTSQHGMIWVSPGLQSTGQTPTDINRLSSFIGVMTQSDNVAADLSPPSGDIETARLYGARLKDAALRWHLS